jgi:pimeloyl-ACP methyl ester carboxylesterase
MKKNFSPLIFFLIVLLVSFNNNNLHSTIKNKIPPAPELKSIFINGDSIHYIDTGKGDPVVFVHGLLSDYRIWWFQIDAFAKNHRVIAYSRRFAYPNKQTINDSEDLTVISQSKDLSEFLKALNLGPVHLVGHSFGATTALETTINHPELVRSLSLCDPFFPSLIQSAPGGDTVLNNFIVKTVVPMTEAFKNNDSESAVRDLITGVMGDSLYYSRIPPQYREVMMENTAEARGMTLSKNIYPQLTCDDVKKIKVPVLLLTGSKSPLIFSSTIYELNNCLSNKDTATLLNASHGLESENPVGFNKIVLGFIDKH